MASFVAFAVRLPPTEWLYTTLVLHPTLDNHLLPDNIFHVGSNLNRIFSLFFVRAAQPGTPILHPMQELFCHDGHIIVINGNDIVFVLFTYWNAKMSHCIAGIPSPSSVLAWVPSSSSSLWCDTCDLLCGLKPAHVWVPTRGLTGANGNGYAAEKWCPSF